MLVHIVESCPVVHSRFVPKLSANKATANMSLEEIIMDDASVLPFGITCINITDMLAKFLLFSKAIDKMDALLSAKPFWKMFIDPNAMLVLQEVSLDLLCDVCVEIGRERRIAMLEVAMENREGHPLPDDAAGMSGSQNGKVTVFDFSEIMERTEKRVGDEVLGPGPRNIEELRTIARRVKSKYLLRIQLKEKHSPSAKRKHDIPKALSSSDMLMKNVTSSVIDGVGGLMSRLKKPSQPPPTRSACATAVEDTVTVNGRDVSDIFEGQVSPDPPDSTPSLSTESTMSRASSTLETAEAPFPRNGDTEDEVDELERLSAELGDLSAATAEAFDLLGEDFDGMDVEEELLDTMDRKVDPFAAFTTDGNDFLS